MSRTGATPGNGSQKALVPMGRGEKDPARMYMPLPTRYNQPRQEEQGRSRTTTRYAFTLLRCCIAVKARYEQHPDGTKVILDAHDGILASRSG
jgi:hypothetical protein